MIGVLVNPNSRSNRKAPGQGERLRAEVRHLGEVVETPSLEAIEPALRKFREDGHRFLVADGGDGALHWMINTLADALGPEEAANAGIYVPTAGGTVDFVAHAIGLQGSGVEVVRRLADRVARGERIATRAVPSLLLEGTQVGPDGTDQPFRRIGFGNALAGYGANFFIPFYAGDTARGPLRIVATAAAMFGVATTRGLVPSSLKSARLKEAEHVYLHPAHAQVEVDGVLLREDDGTAMTHHTVLHCASIPLNLSGVFRVFPRAGEGRMHIHAGHVSPVEMARIMPRLTTGRGVDHLLPRAFDGCGSTLDIRCIGESALDPILDGELYRSINRLSIRMGPIFTMAVP